MAIINLRSFAFGNGGFEEHDEVSLDTTDADAMKKARELNKKGSVMLVPVLEDGTIDTDGVKALLTPGRRTGTPWSKEMVLQAHKMRAEEGKSDLKIQLELYVAFKKEVTAEAVKKVLRQELYSDVELPNDLREKVIAKTPAKGSGNRNKVSEETRLEILEDMRNGMTGVAAAKKHGITSSTANNIYRKEYGYRRPQ